MSSYHSHAEACNRLCRGCGQKVILKKIPEPPYNVPDVHHSVPLDADLVESASRDIEVLWSEDRGSDSVEPRRLCTKCRLLLTLDSQWREYGMKVLNIPRAHDTNSCDICALAFKAGRSKKTIRGRQHIMSPKMKYVKICRQCCLEVGNGIPHKCLKKSTPQNIVQLTRKSFIPPVRLVSAVLHTRGTFKVQSGKAGRHLLNVTAGTRKVTVHVSADDLLKESSSQRMSRRTLIAKSQLWRQRLSDHGVNSKIAGVNAVRRLREARIGDLFEISSIRANIGTEKNPKFEDVPVVRCTNVVELGRRVASHRNTVLNTVKIQGDHGQKALKVSIQFTESNSVNDLMVVAATECSGESCVTLAGILSIVRPVELERLGGHLIWAGDLKFIQLLLGIKTGNTTFPCPWCYWRMTGAERMLPNTTCPTREAKKDIAVFIKGGYNRERTAVSHGQQYVPEFIINPHDISPPTLHILLGVTNMIDEKLSLKHGEEAMIGEWYEPANVRKSVYQGGTFEGNQCKKLIRAAAGWKRGHKFAEYQPLFQSLLQLVEQVFSVRSDLSDEEILSIALCIEEFLNLWNYYRAHGLGLTHPLKLHVLAVHVVDFCERYRATPATYGEQDGESLHRRFFKVCDFMLVPLFKSNEKYSHYRLWHRDLT